MGVGEQLGLGAGVESDLLVEAAGRWPSWVLSAPELVRVGGLDALQGWLRVAEAADADLALHSLVRLGSPTGGTERAAAAVVAWALVPGACCLARRLAGVSPRIDELVASQLWIEVRSFPWKRLRKVAANVLANTRAGVLQECGVASRPLDRSWAKTVLVDLDGPVRNDLVHQDSGCAADPAEELVGLLDAASRGGVLQSGDRWILDRLVAHADGAASSRSRRGQGGLLGNSLVRLVAEEAGVSPSTVRRRTRRAVSALSAARRDGRIEAA